MEFEFDDKKSETNEQKHGVNFTDAQELWDEPDAIIIPLRFKDENRFIVTGIFKEKNWSAICTERNGKLELSHSEGPIKRRRKFMKTASAEKVDRMFDEGKDMREYMDLKKIEHVHPRPKQVSISIPSWLANSLDEEARRRGIARKAMINTALVEWVDDHKQNQAA